jgi:hypothetical protein
MTATDAPARPAPSFGAPASARSLARLLWVELRRSPWPWVLPVLAVLFVFDPYRTAMSYPAVWGLRASVVPNKLVPDFVAFVAGFAAWAGSRDGRRHVGDMLTATARPAWVRRGVALAAGMCWTLATYLACVAVLYVAIARQVSWGGPPLWPVAVGAAALAAMCGLGFAAGTFFPGRFTAPLAALGGFMVSVIAFQDAVGKTGGYVLLSPSGSVPYDDVGVYYHYLPDLAIAQVMFLAGIAVATVGVLGLRGCDSGRWLRRTAAVITSAGLAAAATAAGLASTSRTGTHGVVISALHDAASDRPVPYTPVCGGTRITVCVHPAFRAQLPATITALNPALGELAGLPGAPVKAQEVAVNTTPGWPAAHINGSPPVFYFEMLNTPGSFGVNTAGYYDSLRGAVVIAFATRGGYAGVPGTVAGGAGTGAQPSQAQQVVEAALLESAGVPLSVQGSALGDLGLLQPAFNQQSLAAVNRFAALSASVRRAWLTTHIAALRAGHITLAELP